MPTNDSKWPELNYRNWSDTSQTLHLWTQIVGKIRLKLTPWVNHSWHVTLYVTPRGLTTSPIYYQDRSFQIDFDFIDHKLIVQTSRGDVTQLQLRPQSVANFYHELFDRLHSLGIDVSVHGKPNEIADAVPFAEDQQHASYDREYANRFFRCLFLTDRSFKNFRARFRGKCSPVHFFWGSFDLAVTRFSGRSAPQHPGGVPNLPDWIAREAYSHEVSSCGFWPGAATSDALFYSYAYPEPAGFKDFQINPAAAYYSSDLREFVLPYEELRASATPEETLMQFLQTTYEAAATCGNWHRGDLELSIGN